MSRTVSAFFAESIVFSLEPQRTPFDLHFLLLGIPVRIHPGFWIAGFILGFGWSSNGTRPLPVLIWIGVTFVSILVHELGHALFMRRFGFMPRIVLYHMGGLAIRDQGFLGLEPRRSRNDTWESILISLAGPGAGFMLAAITVLLVFLAGGVVKPDFNSWTQPWDFSVPGVRDPGPFAQGGPWWYVIQFSLFVNIFWGLVNLVPVFPLDGGQVARELFMAKDRYRGLTHTLQLSIGVGIVTAAFFLLVAQEQFAALMFALLAVNNYLMLQQVGRFS
jgi:membrane-associated protease RseP (regulator of RpoE activity)